MVAMPMPAGVGYSSCSFTFIYMIPLPVKLQNFPSLYLFVYLFNENIMIGYIAYDASKQRMIIMCTPQQYNI